MRGVGGDGKPIYRDEVGGKIGFDWWRSEWLILGQDSPPFEAASGASKVAKVAEFWPLIEGLTV